MVTKTGLTVNSYTLYMKLLIPQVLAENSVGKTASTWVLARTGEAMPLFTPGPTVTPLSSTELEVKWNAPTLEESRGTIVSYLLYFLKKTDLTAYPHAPPFIWIVSFIPVSWMGGHRHCSFSQSSGSATASTESDLYEITMNELACFIVLHSRRRSQLMENANHFSSVLIFDLDWMELD